MATIIQLVRATVLLFLFQLKRTLLSRRTLLAVLAALLPVLLALLINAIAAQERHGPPPVLPIAWLLQVRVVVPLVALLLGAGVVAEEVEDRTITYLFVRPVPRAAVLLGRWLATAVVLVVVLAASTLLVLWLLERSARIDPDQALPAGTGERILAMVVAGGLVYSALFAALGTFLKHPILVGAGYVFAIEGLLGVLPGEGQTLTVQFYLKSYLVGGDARLAKLVELIPEAMGTVELASRAEAWSALIWILVASLAVGSWAVSRKQYVVPA